jgi:hypothetical protein
VDGLDDPVPDVHPHGHERPPLVAHDHRRLAVEVHVLERAFEGDPLGDVGDEPGHAVAADDRAAGGPAGGTAVRPQHDVLGQQAFQGGEVARARGGGEGERQPLLVILARAGAGGALGREVATGP